MNDSVEREGKEKSENEQKYSLSKLRQNYEWTPIFFKDLK